VSPKDRYAVVGHPVSHSKSPRIHAEFARQTGQVLSYETLEAAENGFAEAVRGFIATGGRGLNVTVPFKPEACDFVDALSERASIARAVNTIIVEPDGATRGDNTDGAGLLRDLSDNNGIAVDGMRVLIAGAGGAVRGVLEPLLRAGPAEFVIANRTVARARELCDALFHAGDIEACGYEELAGRRFDLIINGTSSGIDGTVPPIPGEVLLPDACAYDMFYASGPTAFVRWALERGAAKAFDGTGMLVEQAAESFYLWRGVWPETGPVIDMLRGG